MNEKTLLKIAVICALVGIFILYVISENIKVNETTISNIEGKDAGEDVKIKGIVKDVFKGEKATVITITKPEEIKVILYGKNISFEKGQYVEVIGEIGEDMSETEIVGNRIRVIS